MDRWRDLEFEINLKKSRNYNVENGGMQDARFGLKG